MSAIYTYVVEIYEPGKNYPVVEHRFHGRSRKEALHYHEAHRQSDAFLRSCEDKGMYPKAGPCRAVAHWAR